MRGIGGGKSQRNFLTAYAYCDTIKIMIVEGSG